MPKLTSKVNDEHLNTPHFVEWSVSEEDEETEEQYFSNREDAKIFASDKQEQKMATYLGEIGTYETESGNFVRDYIYYWWNEYFPLREVEGRGFGYPYRASTKKVSYEPLDKRGWKE
ncbi:MAG: hypothetical protein CFE31_17345 [Rhizobiales bacterium PAR1]|nr:MAG: hypothetical protein CFE31_17345 [Rhizobiales bacterium PAR1]